MCFKTPDLGTGVSNGNWLGGGWGDGGGMMVVGHFGVLLIILTILTTFITILCLVFLLGSRHYTKCIEIINPAHSNITNDAIDTVREGDWGPHCWHCCGGWLR